MTRLIILFVFLSIQFYEYQAAVIHHSSLDDIDDPLLPSPVSSPLLNLWYDRLNHLENTEAQDNLEHIWKRLSPDSIQFRQRRRFGNTRYGRSINQ